MFSTVFFDLDDTLYPADSGLWQAIRGRITRYMVERVGIPADGVEELRAHYYHTYGTVLRGLELHHRVDREDYLAYVHDVPLREFIAPRPGQREAILRVPGRRWIFTNADAAHAARVLAVLDLEGCFQGVIDVHALTPYCKPEPEAFEIALRLAAEPDARRCVLIDDLPRTTRLARERGLFTVLAGRPEPGPDADAALTAWSDLPALLEHAARERGV